MSRELFRTNRMKNAYLVYLTKEEIKEIINALEKSAGKKTELGNDLKMVLAGVL